MLPFTWYLRKMALEGEQIVVEQARGILDRYGFPTFQAILMTVVVMFLCGVIWKQSNDVAGEMRTRDVAMTHITDALTQQAALLDKLGEDDARIERTVNDARGTQRNFWDLVLGKNCPPPAQLDIAPDPRNPLK